MAAELRSAVGAEVTLVKGTGGVFDVAVDGTLVFSKHRVGRFPDPGEVVRLVRQHMQGKGQVGKAKDD